MSEGVTGSATSLPNYANFVEARAGLTNELVQLEKDIEKGKINDPKAITAKVRSITKRIVDDLKANPAKIEGKIFQKKGAIESETFVEHFKDSKSRNKWIDERFGAILANFAQTLPEAPAKTGKQSAAPALLRAAIKAMQEPAKAKKIDIEKVTVQTKTAQLSTATNVLKASGYVKSRAEIAQEPGEKITKKIAPPGRKPPSRPKVEIEKAAVTEKPAQAAREVATAVMHLPLGDKQVSHIKSPPEVHKATAKIKQTAFQQFISKLKDKFENNKNIDQKWFQSILAEAEKRSPSEAAPYLINQMIAHVQSELDSKHTKEARQLLSGLHEIASNTPNEVVNSKWFHERLEQLRNSTRGVDWDLVHVGVIGGLFIAINALNVYAHSLIPERHYF